MAQFSWAYTGTSGKQYVVGIYHGSESGHTLVYCDFNVIHIDFSVLQNWKYSFFIEEDLLELKIERRLEGFQYHFDLNRQIDTPKNRARNAQERHDKRMMTVFLSLMGALLIFLFSAWWYNEVRVDATELATVQHSNWKTPARVFVAADESEIRYSFVVDGESYKYQTAIPEAQQMLLPLQSGDEFMVRYNRRKPHIHMLDFLTPTEPQIKRYKERALELHATLNPHLDKQYIVCLLELAFAERGVDGYADFYYQKASPQDNSEHNRNTYGRLVRDIPFQEKMKEKCR